MLEKTQGAHGSFHLAGPAAEAVGESGCIKQEPAQAEVSVNQYDVIVQKKPNLTSNLLCNVIRIGKEWRRRCE